MIFSTVRFICLEADNSLAFDIFEGLRASVTKNFFSDATKIGKGPLQTVPVAKGPGPNNTNSTLTS